MKEKTPWQKWKEANSGNAKPWDLLNPRVGVVNEDVFVERYSLCIKCPFFTKLTKQCKKCGCFMNQKAKIPHAYCPTGQWGAVKNQDDVV